jgi:lipopolysaccharide transport system ATP-binding protein
MFDTVISVENLSKRYLIGHQSAQRKYDISLREAIGREARNFVRKAGDLLHGRQIIQGDEVEELWALREVNFEVKQGEVLGIIGRNGAGKSTLLKILSRITEPTEGRVRVRGRIASLLEVGTGFHPELTGRENIYLNGSILGMSRAEIRRKFDEIVAFADLEKFLDTPVKRYSSGMYVRLAFAVAAHLEPEVLIVDEVLAVGDADFQKKCIGKMDEVSRREGRTVLLVSHNIGPIITLCPNAIWLHEGSIREHGDSRKVVGEYLAQRTQNQERTLALENFPRTIKTDGRLRLRSLEWLCKLPLRHGEPVTARIHFSIQMPIRNVILGIGFSSIDGRRLLTYDSDFQQGYCPSFNEPGIYSVDIQIGELPLSPDLYALDVGARYGDFGSSDLVTARTWLDIVPGYCTTQYVAQNAGGVRLGSSWMWKREVVAAV